MFEDGFTAVAVWLDIDALVVRRTRGGGYGKLLVSSVIASLWYIRWNKVSASICLLCAND